MFAARLAGACAGHFERRWRPGVSALRLCGRHGGAKADRETGNACVLCHGHLALLQGVIPASQRTARNG
jgi:hypothetical protein